MKNSIKRKCTSRNKNGKRWGIEFPLQWVEELDLKEATIELKKTDTTIIIKKIGTLKISEDGKDSEVNNSETTNNGPTITRY